MKIKRGVTRIVLLVGKVAIKFPNCSYSHLNFLYGCYANWSERNYCKMFKSMPEFYELVAPCLFCSWFGLFAIYKRAKLNTEELTEQELSKFHAVRGGETKPNNFGFIDDKLVCLDYP